MDRNKTERNCPYCGAPLPEGASFCFQCARSIEEKKEPDIPRPVPRRILRPVILAVLVLAAVALICFLNRPQTFDGLGEVFYTDRESTYQLTFAKVNDPFSPIPVMELEEEEGGEFRMPVQLHIHDKATGANAYPVFREKVKSVTAEFLQDEGTEYPLTCTPPEHQDDYIPEAAWVGFIDFIGGDTEGQLVFTITMKNGDVIHLRQNYVIRGIRVVEYHPGDVPMETDAELHALLERIRRERAASSDIFRIYLPPVTYREELRIGEGQLCNLIGTDGPDGSCTTFTQTLMVDTVEGPLPQIEHIRFQGDGTGVGISSPRNLHVLDCSFTGWKTGILAYGRAWVNINGSTFEDNRIGFHFNSQGNSVTHTQYCDNRFAGNETAILLERVPSDLRISFDNTYFEGNGTDIDNRCSHDIDISKAIFR